MLSRQAKAAFYTVAGPLMRVNGLFYKTFRSPRRGMVKVHLGPGQTNYIPGWINVDANIFSGKADLWADLRNPLPFHDNSVDAMYSHHVIEHLPNFEKHISDIFRCLKPGGVLRVGGPNGDSAIAKFAANDKAWFGDFPDKRESIGGRFETFIFCRQEHVTILTFSFLDELLRNAGFDQVRRCISTRETAYHDLFSECLKKEWESDFETPRTLIVEATKPV